MPDLPADMAEERAAQLIETALELRQRMTPAERRSLENYVTELRRPDSPDWKISMFELRAVMNELKEGVDFWRLAHASKVEVLKILVILRSVVEDWSQVRLRGDT